MFLYYLLIKAQSLVIFLKNNDSVGLGEFLFGVYIVMFTDVRKIFHDDIT